MRDKQSDEKVMDIEELKRELAESRAAIEALRRDEEEYRRRLESIEEGYYEVDLNGNSIFFNEAMCRILGRSPAEMRNLNHRDYTSPETAKRIFKVFNKIYDGGPPAKVLDYEIIRKDGSIVMAEFSASLLKDASGKPVGFHGVVRDRTEQKRAEKALAESEEKYRNILETMSEGYYECDLKGKFIFINQALADIHGRTRKEMMGLDNRNYASPETAKKIFKIYNELFRTGAQVRISDYEIIRKDGSVIWVEISASLLKDSSGEIIGFRGIVRNWTDQKKAEKALSESEERYRIILESINEGYYEVDLAGNFTFCNDALSKIHGRTQEEMIGLNHRGYTSPETAKRIYRIFNEMYRREGKPTRIIDYEIIRKDGSIVSAEFSASLLKDGSGNITGFRGIVRDRTEQSKVEKALRDSEEKYRTILETMEEGYYEVDLDGTRTFCNDALCRIYGYTYEEMIGMNYRTYAPSETGRELRKIYGEVYRTGIPAKINHQRAFRKDGTPIEIEASVALKRDNSGNPIGFRGIIVDKTEHIKWEKALRQSEEKYRLLVENAHDAIYILQDGLMRFCNRRTATLTGYSAEDLAMAPFEGLICSGDRDKVMEWQRKVLAGEDQPDTFSFQIRNRRNDILWVELDAVAMNWEDRPATLNFLRDITAQKKMEVQFIQAQKMEAIGTLAGGIAHDFNNLLMGIQGNASLMLLKMQPHDPNYARLKNIEQQVQAGAALTRQMLGVAKGGKYEVKATNINKLIEAGLDLYGRTRKEIRVHKHFQENLWTVEVDRSQIEQVLLNLYVNAGHAMPAGGDLYVETKNITLDESYTARFGIRPGTFVRISVTDTGVGMDEATQKRAFDPFFTTKDMGRGTGLGLASAYGIVKNHNGIINVYSEKGKGATFNIYLPATDKDVAEEKPARFKITKGTETILLVDDQEAIIEIGVSLLHELGYKVISAGGGLAAIDIYRREGGRIGLVILDMIMPEIGGGETFERLKEIDPNVKVILSSGYTINGQAKEILDRGCKGFLQKPFGLEELSKKIRQVLDEK